MRVVYLELGTACGEEFLERRAEGRPDGRRVMLEGQPGSAVPEAGRQAGPLRENLGTKVNTGKP